jgi:NADP-dependent 3-hydroxy acid dehydrogenase YdfG
MLAEMNVNMKTNQERMEAILKEMMKRQRGSLVLIMEANRKTDRDETKQEIRASQEHMQEMIKTNQDGGRNTLHAV